jgi:hypothetical protein
VCISELDNNNKNYQIYFIVDNDWINLPTRICRSKCVWIYWQLNVVVQYCSSVCLIVWLFQFLLPCVAFLD